MSFKIFKFATYANSKSFVQPCGWESEKAEEFNVRYTPNGHVTRFDNKHDAEMFIETLNLVFTKGIEHQKQELKKFIGVE
jgi:hypothetical protein